VARKGKIHEWLTQEGRILHRGWCMDGLTDKQIADKMHVSEATLYNWLKDERYLEFLEDHKKGREVADFEVENALYRNATGYEREEVVLDNKGVEHVITKWYPPNTAAQIFWMKNRKKWKDKPEDTEADAIRNHVTITFGSEEMEEYGD
jgi:transcriptional regulator with XRE-family HTH domain